MVVRIQLTIKHIRGHTFPIDADVESDVLGLKVLIWEAQNIPIDNQRLVFGGKELEDNLKLTDLGIDDNAMIFLVEGNSGIAQQPQAEVQPPVVSSQVEIPIKTKVPISICNNNNNSVSKCPYQQLQLQSQGIDYYAPFDDESVLSEERMECVIRLGKWIRIYCLLGMFVSLIYTIGSLYSLIPFIMYVFGFIGTRKLNRCLLFFPLVLVMVLGFGLFSMSIYWLIADYSSNYFITLFIGLMHMIIFSCLCKFMCRISKLSCQEWWQARLRIQANGCCC